MSQLVIRYILKMYLPSMCFQDTVDVDIFRIELIPGYFLIYWFIFLIFKKWEALFSRNSSGGSE